MPASWPSTVVRWLVASALAAITYEAVLRPVYTLAMTHDPDFGPVIRSGSTTRWGTEGFAESHWSDRGVRTHASPASSNGARILALGDSQTEALMVKDDEVYTAVLQRELGSVAVLNAGKSSHSLADHVALAPAYRRVFQQAWTVVELQDDDLTADAWSQAKTHFVAHGSEVSIVAPPNPARSGLLWRLRQESSLVGFSFVRLGLFRRAMDTEPPLFQAASVANAAVENAPPAYPIQAEIDALKAAYDGRVTILYLSRYWPDAPSRQTETGAALRTACKNAGIELVDLGGAFAEFVSAGTAPYGFPNSAFNSGHLNSAGHRAAGHLLAQSASLGALR